MVGSTIQNLIEREIFKKFNITVTCDWMETNK
jgi:hypothetical protein